MATYSPIPTSTIQSATGASYTVPSGFYAVARVYCSSGAQVTINGVFIVAESAGQDTISSYTLVTGDTIVASAGSPTFHIEVYPL